MILQALSEEYERLKNNPEEEIPLRGFSREKVYFSLILDKRGTLLQVEDLRNEKKMAKTLIVPEVVKRSVNITANFMCDSTGYVLGCDNKENPERAMETFEAFKKLHHSIGDGINDDGMKAVLMFLDSWKPEILEHSICWPVWAELAGMKIVFRLDGERSYVHESAAVKKAWLEYYNTKRSEYSAFCLVSGNKEPIARLHNSIKGIKDAQSTGADIVSCNLDAFKSYKKEQSFNSPISEEAMFNYTTALNYMLRKESRQKIQIGDATTVFWAEGNTPITGFLKDILDPRENTPDLSNLRLFLEAIREGKRPELADTENLKFYILGLAPNAKRLSVRFWRISTVEEMSRKIGQHFKDLQIQREFNNDSEFPSLWKLLHKTAVQEKTENISPLLAGSFMRSIITGSVYPRTILTATIERIRAEQEVGYYRAALIKAYLNRNLRIQNKQTKEVTVSLDKEQKDVGYLLGRLFAALEKAQKDALPSANTTIKDRFYGSASATPSVVFPQLLRLAQHHIQKSEYGRNTERFIEEIVANVQAFPSHLGLEEQGMFALGYYHQKPEFYKKSETKMEGNV